MTDRWSLALEKRTARRGGGGGRALCKSARRGGGGRGGGVTDVWRGGLTDRWKGGGRHVRPLLGRGEGGRDRLLESGS